VLVLFSDIFICCFSVWLAFGLRSNQWGYLQGNQWIALCCSIGFSIPLFISFGLYQAIFRYIGANAFIAIMRVFIIYSGLFFFTFTIIGLNDVPRSIGVIQPLLLFVGIGAVRYLIRSWLGGFDFEKLNNPIKNIALIYGAGLAGRQLASALSSNNEFLVKGFIDDDQNLQRRTINGISVYSFFDLQNLIHRMNITDVLLAIPSVSHVRRKEIISSLSGHGVRVRTMPGMNDLAAGRVRISDLHDLDMNDLLGRDVVAPDIDLLEKNIFGQSVLVTGAGGSIGSELCRQIIKCKPKSLILLDSSEYSLYLIYEELIKVSLLMRGDDLVSADRLQLQLVPCLASVRDSDLLMKIFKAYNPDTVFHAAAYKHVPLVEKNASEGINNNVFGTINCAQVSLDCGVSQFILVSTDKAVRPSNVMGASKRIAELALQAMSQFVYENKLRTTFAIVRFGNVLGSSGSVVPLFRDQISAGGPVTLTHPDVTRYFMSIPEAAQLVMQAGAMAKGGDVFVLDMGEPVRIYDLAVRMIFLSGLLIKTKKKPYGDIEIKVTGLRPGEKLFEELLIGENPQKTEHPKIMKAHEDFLSWNELCLELAALKLALDTSNVKSIQSILKKLVSGYHTNAEIE